MPNEIRVRQNFIGGKVEDNPLTNVATTLTSGALAAVPVIGSTQHYPITLDPDGIYGEPEIAYITAHSAAATTATILRSQEGTVARQHLRDTDWTHGPTVFDFDMPMARAYHSTAQSIANNTLVAATLDSEDFDMGSYHSTVTNTSRMTISTGGWYVVTGGAAFVAAGTGIRAGIIFKNSIATGTRLGHSTINSAGAGDPSRTQVTSGPVRLEAGDYVELALYQSSGSSLNTEAGSAYTFLAIERRA